MSELTTLYNAIIKGDAASARASAQAALQQGADPLALVNDSMIPAMDEVGRRYQAHEYFVPELLLAARAMKGCLELVRPLLKEKGARPVGRVVIGTVKGDLHDIGKNLVASLLEGGGFEVIDLGVNVTPEKFVETVRDKNPDIIALSALLTTTMPAMRTTVDSLKAAQLRQRVKVLVGGAPVTRKFAEEIGADAYSDNAVGAVTIAKQQLRNSLAAAVS